MLHFMRLSSNLLSLEALKDESAMAKLLVDTMFQQKMNVHVRKQRLIVRRIVSKLMKRCGVPFVTKIMPEHHRPIIAYIEKVKRKKTNKIQQEKLLALLGGRDAGGGDEANKQGQGADDSSGESSDGDEAEGQEPAGQGEQSLANDGSDEDMSDSESEEEDVVTGRGTDVL